MMSSLVLMVLAATPKVASPAWNVVDVKPELASFYAEQLADALRTEGLAVTTAADISTLLGNERQRQLLGCAEAASCMAELANALGCDATLTVSLAKLGKGFRGVAKLMSSRDGTVLSSVRLDANGEAELSDQLVAAAKTLAAPLQPSGATTTVTRKVTLAPKLWWLPGAVGVVAGGVGAALFVLANGKYADLARETNATQGRQLANDGQALQTAAWVTTSVGVAAVVGSLAWLLFGSTPVEPQLTFAPGAFTLGVGGHF